MLFETLVLIHHVVFEIDYIIINDILLGRSCFCKLQKNADMSEFKQMLQFQINQYLFAIQPNMLVLKQIAKSS